MEANDWTPPGWDVEVGASVANGWRSLKMECKAEGCGYLMHTGLPPGVDAEGFPERFPPIHDHQAQHGPGRARDIEVDWTPSACCSVCEDLIGDVVQDDDDGLICQECGTTWDRYGSHGETNEENHG